MRRAPRDAPRIRTADIGASPDFRRADRHSRRVRLLRWVLPSIVVVGVAGYLLAASIPRIDLPIDFDAVVINDEGIIIERPELTQNQLNGQAYSVAADRAIQRNGAPNQLVLEGVEATYDLPSGTTARFSAPDGEFNSATTLMRLWGGVAMTMGDGVDLRLEEVTVDVPNSVITSLRPFELQAGNLFLSGNRLEISENDLTITGRVRTTIDANGTTAAMPRIGGGG